MCRSGGGRGVVVGRAASGCGKGEVGVWAWGATLRVKKIATRSWGKNRPGDGNSLTRRYHGIMAASVFSNRQ